MTDAVFALMDYPLQQIVNVHWRDGYVLFLVKYSDGCKPKISIFDPEPEKAKFKIVKEKKIDVGDVYALGIDAAGGAIEPSGVHYYHHGFIVHVTHSTKDTVLKFELTGRPDTYAKVWQWGSGEGDSFIPGGNDPSEQVANEWAYVDPLGRPIPDNWPFVASRPQYYGSNPILEGGSQNTDKGSRKILKGTHDARIFRNDVPAKTDVPDTEFPQTDHASDVFIAERTDPDHPIPDPFPFAWKMPAWWKPNPRKPKDKEEILYWKWYSVQLGPYPLGAPPESTIYTIHNSISPEELAKPEDILLSIGATFYGGGFVTPSSKLKTGVELVWQPQWAPIRVTELSNGITFNRFSDIENFPDADATVDQFDNVPWEKGSPPHMAYELKKFAEVTYQFWDGRIKFTAATDKIEVEPDPLPPETADKIKKKRTYVYEPDIRYRDFTRRFKVSGTGKEVAGQPIPAI